MSTATATPESVTVGDTTVSVGDFFVASWGYDQTNVDFYKVVGFTASGKSVKIQPWSQSLHGGAGGPVEHVVPGEGPATYADWSATTPEMDYWERQAAMVVKPQPVETKRLTPKGYGGVWLSMSSYKFAHLWDGTPQYKTGGGWGH